MQNDLISRSALLEEISKGTIIPDDLYGMGIMAGVDAMKKKIENAPTIDPESLRPKGQWTVIEGDYWNEDVIYQCSECKEEFVSFDGTNLEKLWNYCPNCGADMRER